MPSAKHDPIHVMPPKNNIANRCTQEKTAKNTKNINLNIKQQYVTCDFFPIFRVTFFLFLQLIYIEGLPFFEEPPSPAG